MKDKKILLVTGASSDIGMGLIRKVYRNYSIVLAHYRTENDQLLQLQDDIGKERCLLIKADFSEPEDIARLISDIREADLIPDHIVHLPAPKAFNKKFHKCTLAEYRQELQISFLSIEEILRTFIPYMSKNRYGKIILMLSSCCINNPPKYQAPYVTTKYALMGLMKSLSVEYADKGITVNAVSPDMIETKFLSEVPDLIIETNAAAGPTGRNLQVEDVTPAIQFLLSEDADMITGTNITITGGK